MERKCEYWTVTMRDKRLCIAYATRLPRKQKKLLRSIFNAVGREAEEYALVSPYLSNILWSNDE